MVDFYSRSCQEAMKWGLSLLIHTWIPGYMYCCYVNQVSLHSDLYRVMAVYVILAIFLTNFLSDPAIQYYSLLCKDE